MKVGVAYALPNKQVWLKIEVPEECTVKEAIEHSGLLKQFPEIDLTKQKVGIFGKVAKLEAKVEENCRVEIYRPITVDPTTVERRDLPRDD